MIFATPSPLVSIIIVTWNSKAYLLTCLDSLTQQTFRDFEVILVDNASIDGDVNGVVKNYPSLNIHIKKNSSNLGFSIANNVAAQISSGKWLALLNADAFPEPDWLENLIKATELFPNAFFASQQIQANVPDLLDGEGDVYHVSGLAWRRNYGFPVQKKYDLEEIFSPCAAAALYPRQAFLDAGGFDEDFFSYHEDVDLGFRLRLLGFRSYFVPQAIVFHIGSASTGKKGDFSVYYGHRNLVWSYFKNMPILLFWLFLPVHLFMNIAFLVNFIFRGQGKIILQAKRDAICGLSRMLKKRKIIQKKRKVSIRALYSVMEHGLFTPLRVLIRRKKV